jgi:signal transduction histidine kinase
LTPIRDFSIIHIKTIRTLNTQPVTVVIHTEESIKKDIERVGRIAVIPTLLDVVAQTTGMGFAAVARVTRDRWVACGVRDEINFGLRPGDELKVESTICNEIRDSGKAVIIDHVSEDADFCDHHTPKMYGFQSYISVPIFLQDGAFFGTLCAIDPRPNQLKNDKVIGMFTLFAQLISFHLAGLRDAEIMDRRLNDSNRELTNFRDEIRQYQHLSNHNFQEPLRKIRLFADILLMANERGDEEKIKFTAQKINHFARGLTEMIKDLTDFSGLGLSERSFELTDLNEILVNVCDRLALTIKDQHAVIEGEVLHTIRAVPGQIARLFYHLISNSLKYSRPGVELSIRIYSHELTGQRLGRFAQLDPDRRYCEICFEDNGQGIEADQLDKIFEISPRGAAKGRYNQGLGIGLAQCRRITRNHGGLIFAESEPGKKTVFSVVLPIE